METLTAQVVVRVGCDSTRLWWGGPRWSKGAWLLLFLLGEIVARCLVPMGSSEANGAATDTPKAGFIPGFCARTGFLSMLDLT